MPIEMEKTGKDVVVDWYFLDDFDTNNRFYIDANGLAMIPK
jgi:hypothetical protein